MNVAKTKQNAQLNSGYARRQNNESKEVKRTKKNQQQHEQTYAYVLTHSHQRKFV